MKKTEKNILIAFILNLSFSIFEFFGGAISHSVAIFSDSIHDLGDAISIGLAYFLEKKSRKKADATHTYGYIRYSVLGGVITSGILVAGGIVAMVRSVGRLITPVEVDSGKTILFAVIGVVLNMAAAYITREGDSINQKAVNLHMFEDVLTWLVVLVGAVVIKFTKASWIDPLMSLGVAVFILYHAAENLKQVLDLFLEKTPTGMDLEELRRHLLRIEGVEDVHHIHVRSMDGFNNYATMHIVTKVENPEELKREIREELAEHGVCHAVLETEKEPCEDRECNPRFSSQEHHHHHHHH